MNLLKRHILSAVALLLLIGPVSVPVDPVYAVNVDDCKSIDLDSCKDVDMLDALCDKLFSNLDTCEDICKSIATGEKVGDCVVCCSNVRWQLDLAY